MNAGEPSGLDRLGGNGGPPGGPATPPAGKAPKLDWRGRLAGALLGFAVGMTVNLATDDFGYPGLIIAVSIGAVFATASWLRRVPAKAPLARYTTRLLLTAASLTVLVTLAVPSRARLWCLATGLAMIAIAVLMAADLATAAILATGAGFIGAGAALVGIGIRLVIGKDSLVGAAIFIAFGFGMIRSGTLMLSDRQALIEGAKVGYAYRATVAGLEIPMPNAILTTWRTLADLAQFAMGLAFVIFGIIEINGEEMLFGVMGIGLGLGLTGIASLRLSHYLGAVRSRLARLIRDPELLGSENSDGIDGP